MKDIIPFSEYPEDMYTPIVIPEAIAKKALDEGYMTKKQWDLRDTHCLFIVGRWIAVSKLLPTSNK